jgi:hypothetical protein
MLKPLADILRNLSEGERTRDEKRAKDVATFLETIEVLRRDLNERVEAKYDEAHRQGIQRQGLITKGRQLKHFAAALNLLRIEILQVLNFVAVAVLEDEFRGATAGRSLLDALPDLRFGDTFKKLGAANCSQALSILEGH